MIMMTVFVKVSPEKQEEFLQAMRSLTASGKKPKGLRKSTLYQEADDHTGFSLIYEWEKERDLDRYLNAEKFGVLLAALKVLAEKSEITYRQISEKLPDLTGGTCERRSELKARSE